ncbi:MAG: MAPEG family protein [Pseudomonadota bacterium]
MELNLPVYSAYLAGFLIILQTYLAASAGFHRGRNRKPIGYADDPDLERKVRRHANIAEYAPIFIAALTLYELILGQTTSVLVLAIMFGTARIFHLIGFASSSGSHMERVEEGGRKYFVFARMAGAGFSLLSSFALGGMLIWQVATLS